MMPNAGLHLLGGRGAFFPICQGVREGAGGGPGELCDGADVVTSSPPHACPAQGARGEAPPHPDEDGEEGEGDGSLGAAAPQEELLGWRVLPLVGQEAEPQEPDAYPVDWGRRREERWDGGWESWLRKGCQAGKGRTGSP